MIPKETELLWAEHKRRLLEIASKLKVKWPAPNHDKCNPYGIRSLACLLLCVSFLYAGPNAWNRIKSAFTFEQAQAEVVKKEPTLLEKTKKNLAETRKKKKEEFAKKKKELDKKIAELKEQIKKEYEEGKKEKLQNELKKTEQQLANLEEAKQFAENAEVGKGQADNDGLIEQPTMGKGKNNQQGIDPLGRPTGNKNFNVGGPTQGNVPSEIPIQKSREILNAIREKLSNPNLRTIEREYLERLLQ